MSTEQVTPKKPGKAFSNIVTLILIIAAGYFIYTCDSGSSNKDDGSSGNNAATPNRKQELPSKKAEQNSTKVIPDDPYEIMHIAFEGFPDKEDIQPMMEAVMNRHSFPVNSDNLIKFANVLVVLRKESIVGVTEMEILKHMYQRGDASIGLADQAGVSASYLERTK